MMPPTSSLPVVARCSAGAGTPPPAEHRATAPAYVTQAMLTRRFRVDQDHFRLADHDPADTAGLTHEDGEAHLAGDIEEMVRLQDRLYAADRWALLIVFQAPDA